MTFVIAGAAVILLTLLPFVVSMGRAVGWRVTAAIWGISTAAAITVSLAALLIERGISGDWL